MGDPRGEYPNRRSPIKVLIGLPVGLLGDQATSRSLVSAWRRRRRLNDNPPQLGRDAVQHRALLLLPLGMVVGTKTSPGVKEATLERRG